MMIKDTQSNLRYIYTFFHAAPGTAQSTQTRARAFHHVSFLQKKLVILHFPHWNGSSHSRLSDDIIAISWYHVDTHTRCPWCAIFCHTKQHGHLKIMYVYFCIIITSGYSWISMHSLSNRQHTPNKKSEFSTESSSVALFW